FCESGVFSISMPALSNFLRGRNDPAPAADVVCRPVERPEIEQAVRLILSTGAGAASDEQVLDFLSFAVERKFELSNIWIAVRGNHLVWTLLPVPSPGRTMLLFSPTYVPRSTPVSVI